MKLLERGDHTRLIYRLVSTVSFGKEVQMGKKSVLAEEALVNTNVDSLSVQL